MRAAERPAYVTYRVAYRGSGATLRCEDGRLAVSFGGSASTGAYRVSFRTRDGAADSVDANTGRRCSGVPLVDPTGGDIGRLVESAVRVDRPVPDPSAPGTIATVRVFGALHYRIESLRLEPLDGTNADHLTLRAIDDPATYALTDLWIDPAGYAIRRVRGSFADTYGGAPATILATGDFQRFGAAWLLVHEHVEFAASTEPRSTGATLDADASAFAFPVADPVEPLRGR